MDSIELDKCKEWYSEMSQSDKLKMLEYLFKLDRHKWDYASMPVSLRKFYDSKEVREK